MYKSSQRTLKLRADRAMNALRLSGILANLGRGNVVTTAGGSAHGHLDSPTPGAIALSQSCEC